MIDLKNREKWEHSFFSLWITQTDAILFFRGEDFVSSFSGFSYISFQGFGLTKQLVLQKAANLCRLAQLPHPFKEGPAGDSWYRAFMRRNPGLTLRTPSRLSTARGRAMNRAVVGDYFQDVAKYTEGMQPIPIWNMDESGFHFEHQPIKVVCKKGVRAVNSRVSSSRENVTVVACASATGVVMTPMFVVKGKTYKSLHSGGST
ncbi:hypothetical protein LSH36_735g00008 [Paralvinella palmiformis]|uniref:Uncharacterized protein n=1 Tax=Paralvinella palmiformis TaxID=53620 RepID=A0AAD9MT16_9ANNE|nr:hypothetical protein LSH36_735g00008 [Paralvinella palmiformis]